MVKDKFYSGLEVIDLIAYMNITELLQSDIMNTIVSNYWEGPYEKQNVWEMCSGFQLLSKVYNDTEQEGIRGDKNQLGVQNPRRKITTSTLGIRSFKDMGDQLCCRTKKKRSI